MIPNVLSIAGSDPSGGAGIQADLKAISANRAFAMAALTALTAQNTQGVTGIELVPADFVRSQIKTVFDDVRVDAVKIGMIATAEIAEAVADSLADHADVPIVLDPVMVAKGGARLLAADAIAALRTRLLPLASLLTPNLPEAADLLGVPTAETRAHMQSQGEAIVDLGAKAVFLKGGHLASDESPDLLVTSSGSVWFEGRRTPTANTHGTGCTLSSAIAAQLAYGKSLEDAASAAKAYVSDAIGRADQLSVGHGHGPTHHFANLWSQ
ncbi:MAG: bifunctional hydroxymethylpyrimidine kinase/phosphomethylpyrimidine kinase [Pseudomonadota bacterium]